MDGGVIWRLRLPTSLVREGALLIEVSSPASVSTSMDPPSAGCSTTENA